MHNQPSRLYARFVRALCLTLVCLLGFESVVWAAPTITYLHNDTGGSPVAATDATGAIVWRESYRPYGERTKNEAAAGSNTQFFHGKPVDGDTGLSYFGARYYDPIVGRFMGIDPVGFDDANIHSFNRYAYGNNNPYRYRDPDGRLASLLHANQRGMTLDQAEQVGRMGNESLRAGATVAAGASALTPAGRYSIRLIKEALASKQVQSEAQSTPGRGYHRETTSPNQVRRQDVTRKWEEFLGDGPYTDKNPRTGETDPDRIVSADGKRSIRFGNHEMNSSANKFHYHEETWTYDAAKNVMNVDNTIVRIR